MRRFLCALGGHRLRDEPFFGRSRCRCGERRLSTRRGLNHGWFHDSRYDAAHPWPRWQPPYATAEEGEKVTVSESVVDDILERAGWSQAHEGTNAIVDGWDYRPRGS